MAYSPALHTHDLRMYLRILFACAEELDFSPVSLSVTHTGNGEYSFTVSSLDRGTIFDGAEQFFTLLLTYSVQVLQQSGPEVDVLITVTIGT